MSGKDNLEGGERIKCENRGTDCEDGRYMD